MVGDTSGCGLRDDELGEDSRVDEIHRIWLQFALVVIVEKLSENMKIDVTILNIGRSYTSVIKGKWSNCSLTEEWAWKVKLDSVMVHHLVEDWSKHVGEHELTDKLSGILNNYEGVFNPLMHEKS